MRVNLGQEFVIGGYTIGSKTFGALIFGYVLIARAETVQWSLGGQAGVRPPVSRYQWLAPLAMLDMAFSARRP
jgi:hypothetical protein